MGNSGSVVDASTPQGPGILPGTNPGPPSHKYKSSTDTEIQQITDEIQKYNCLT